MGHPERGENWSAGGASLGEQEGGTNQHDAVVMRQRGPDRESGVEATGSAEPVLSLRQDRRKEAPGS